MPLLLPPVLPRPVPRLRLQLRLLVAPAPRVFTLEPPPHLPFPVDRVVLLAPVVRPVLRVVAPPLFAPDVFQVRLVHDPQKLFRSVATRRVAANSATGTLASRAFPVASRTGVGATAFIPAAPAPSRGIASGARGPTKAPTVCTTSTARAPRRVGRTGATGRPRGPARSRRRAAAPTRAPVTGREPEPPIRRRPAAFRPAAPPARPATVAGASPRAAALPPRPPPQPFAAHGPSRSDSAPARPRPAGPCTQQRPTSAAPSIAAATAGTRTPTGSTTARPT